ncbi:hypothetical protein MLD38_028699 [Melastoma candidum]|uniref:Uncharacterized protein n=1 Tax=Melastoma candidum TaxID=119954 RepID=A0ACB9N469_9MYRT|nr:hypothetical protein MLD38_028699 [Melastoma candidum]
MTSLLGTLAMGIVLGTGVASASMMATKVGGGRKLVQVNAVCSKNDIAIYQGPTEPLPSGIPAFTVQILNVCVSNWYITNIHVNCGWFSSVHLVNPRVFRRVDYDDCVVNNGEALSPGQSLSFQYANSFQYPMSVSSVDCS